MKIKIQAVRKKCFILKSESFFQSFYPVFSPTFDSLFHLICSVNVAHICMSASFLSSHAACIAWGFSCAAAYTLRPCVELCAHINVPAPSRLHSTPGCLFNHLLFPPLLCSSLQVLSSLRSFCAAVGCSMRFYTLMVTLWSWLDYLFIVAVLLVSSAARGCRFYAWYRRGDGCHS